MNNQKNAHKEDTPLVSIIVITYNSARFVLETLESAKAQTYENIELIVSDDASTDDTVEICSKWLDENKERFVRTELITVPENTGIPANCNRGLRAAKGEWIKYIAGDDALLEDAIESFVEYLSGKPNAYVVQSLSKRYYDRFEANCLFAVYPKNRQMPFFSEGITSQQQHQSLLESLKVNAPAVFIKKDAVLRVGCFDERFKLLEDYPMWLKLTKAGYKIHFFEKATVKHRFHSDATSSSKDYAFSASHLKNEGFRQAYIYPNLPWLKKTSKKYTYNVRKITVALGLAKNTRFFKRLDALLTKYANPFELLLLIKGK